MLMSSWWVERGGKPPTNHFDLLVVRRASAVGREMRKATNESKQLVGGVWEVVVVGIWAHCCCWVTRGGEEEEATPTSHQDSLAVMVGNEGQGGRR